MSTDTAISLIEDAYSAYADMIFRHCYFRLMDRERGKELMQETFIRALEYARKGSTIEQMKAFLFRIANNLIIDDVRRKKELSLDTLQEEGFDPHGSGEQEILQNLADQEMISILSKLDAPDRDLIIMRYVDGMKPREMSEYLNLNPNIISVRLHRAMKSLEQLIKAA